MHHEEHAECDDETRDNALNSASFPSFLKIHGYLLFKEHGGLSAFRSIPRRSLTGELKLWNTLKDGEAEAPPGAVYENINSSGERRRNFPSLIS